MATPIPDNRAPIARATLERLAGRPLPELPEQILGASTDSRTVQPGMLYVALRGERFDGAAFVPQALAQGAVACLVHEPIAEQPRAIAVADTLVAWGELARVHLTHLRAASRVVVVAVTGSAGKTTTKEMTAALLRLRGPVDATVGNLNNRIGLPATILAAEAPRFLVLEAGMSIPGEMAELARIAAPDCAAVVNIGLAHAEGVGGRDGVAREKGALLAGVRSDGVRVLPYDEPLLASIAGERLHFGAEGADYALLSRELTDLGSSLQIARLGEAPFRIASPFAGQAQALDLLAALALADAAAARAGQLGFAPAEIERALSAVQLHGRGERFAFAGGGFVLDDSYNANPDSMARAVVLLGELAGARRRVLVIGEMRELGRYAEAAHHELGEQIALARPALVIGCGGLAELALDRAEAAGVEVLRGTDGAHAALLAKDAVLPEDAVMVKASRGVRAERVVQALRERFGEP